MYSFVSMLKFEHTAAVSKHVENVCFHIVEFQSASGHYKAIARAFNTQNILGILCVRACN
jgi:hypothetical protein